MFSRRPSSTLILALPRWLGTVVEEAAADMAATVAAAVVVTVAVSVYQSFPKSARGSMLTVMTGRSQGANGANAMPIGQRRW
jgi:hypothetical protein